MGRLRSYSYLPQDLLEEILTRLPVISIIRFKCVNKSWYNLFENHTFIAKHHRHHSSQKNPSLLVEVEDSTTIPQRSVMSLHLADGLDSGVSLDMPFIPERLVYISDCINGIICLRELSSRLVLWNPAVREYKVIPNPPSHVHSPSNVCYDYPTFAFGYDHISNDYKLVQIGTYSTVLYDSIDQILHPVVHIYTLSTDSWRQIDTGFDHSILNFPGECSNNLYLNGVYHWPGCIILDKHGQHCEVIVCFDMRDEVFQIMKMPNLGDISHIEKIWKTASVLNDCAALIMGSRSLGPNNL